MEANLIDRRFIENEDVKNQLNDYIIHNQKLLQNHYKINQQIFSIERFDLIVYSLLLESKIIVAHFYLHNLIEVYWEGHFCVVFQFSKDYNIQQKKEILSVNKGKEKINIYGIIYLDGHREKYITYGKFFLQIYLSEQGEKFEDFDEIYYITYDLNFNELYVILHRCKNQTIKDRYYLFLERNNLIFKKDIIINLNDDNKQNNSSKNQKTKKGNSFFLGILNLWNKINPLKKQKTIPYLLDENKLLLKKKK